MPLSPLIKGEELLQLVITFVMNKQLHTEGSEDALLLQAPNDFHSLAFTYHSKISPGLLQQAKSWQPDSPRVPAGFKGSTAKPDAGKQGRIEAAVAHPPMFPWLCSTAQCSYHSPRSPRSSHLWGGFLARTRQKRPLTSADELYRCEHAFTVLTTQLCATKPS